MSSFGDTPFALRTRGPLPGLSSMDMNGDQQATPSSIPQLSTSIVPSIERQPTSEPIERQVTPEPVDAAEWERTPSPFVKKEPKDTRTYTSFAIKDDENDEYNPYQPYSTLATNTRSAKALYDPARPMPRRAVRFTADRILSSNNGKMFEPPTVCFTPAYSNSQFVHVLKCHGEVETQKPQACGPNCATTTDGDKTLANSWPIECTHKICVEAKEKRHAAVFVPKKRARTARTATPALAAAQASELRRSSRLNHDEKTAELNKLVETEPGYRELAEHADELGNVRRKSKRHAGYAYSKEISEDAAAERLFKITGGLDLSFDETPRMKREMKKLQVDGTEKLRGMGGTFGLKRKAEDEAAAFNAHDKGLGADQDRDMPWSYANSRNPKPGKKAIRNEEAGMFSILHTRYDAMIEEENGVVVEREDVRSHRLPRNAGNTNLEADDEDGFGGFQTIEACHVCAIAGDGQLERCSSCHHHFHAVCAGAGDDVNERGMADALHDDLHHWICDGERCNKHLSRTGVRYKCTNAACRNFDYCLDCFQKKSVQHVLKMKSKGEDPAAHRFVAVRGEFDEAVQAIESAQDTEFVCSGCKDTKYAQKLADQMLSKKTLAPAAIRTKVNKQRKADRRVLSSQLAAVKERVEAEKNSGINKDATARRRSSRKSGSTSMGSMRSRDLKLKLNPKKFAHLMMLNKDSPEIVAARAALPLNTIAEEQEDVEMGEGSDVAKGTGEGEDFYDPELFGEE